MHAQFGLDAFGVYTVQVLPPAGDSLRCDRQGDVADRAGDPVAEDVQTGRRSRPWGRRASSRGESKFSGKDVSWYPVAFQRCCNGVFENIDEEQLEVSMQLYPLFLNLALPGRHPGTP